eukprot:m.319544 g.319544  ORF g.319544 m.319544 type:complete len:104 (+) comp16517_c0_seq72:1730-2041(+)
MQSLMCDVCSFQNLGLISMTVADCVDMSNEFGLSSSCGQFGKCKDDADLYDNQFQGCICDSGFAGHRCDQVRSFRMYQLLEHINTAVKSSTTSFCKQGHWILL